ncbi:kinase-like protein [Byssothecium circinans]|uniref:Kinase-like protein n=1 Tax=Byssothecium circinans TaxID=147558 RepID=A0A6A5UCJ5_9PLEO|nr:kinase-like protein [Byssothecium circinans]
MPLPFDFATLTKDDLHCVGLGLTSEVVRIADTNVVAKIPTPSAVLGLEVHEIEKKVYERVHDRPNILRCLGQSPPECTLLRSALLFEYHSRGSLIDCLDQLKNFARSRWPYQTVSALAYLHSLRVVHADCGLHNFLLCNDGGIVLCDFAGSGIDGGRCFVSHGVRYRDPLCTREYPTEQEDVFALGTVLYELDGGELLFKGMSHEEVHMRLRDRQFPDLSRVSLPLKSIIEKCWTMPGYKASDALEELGKL